MARPTRSTAPKARAVPATRQINDPAFEYAKRFPYLGDLGFLTDLSGKKTAVVISLAAFRRLMRDYSAVASALTMREEDFMTQEEFLAALREDGLLPPEA